MEHCSPAYFLGTDFGFSLKNDGLFDYTGLKRHFSNIQLALRGRHQRANASVALAALELSEEWFPVDETSLRRGLQTVDWPGRLEVMFEQPTVVLDGAHNMEGIRALVDEMNDFRRGRKIRLLFATMVDKEWQLMLGALSKVVDEVVFTRVEMERSADPDQLAQTVGEEIPHRTIHNSQVALRTLLGEARSEDIILVAGSLYLLGEIRPMLLDIATARARSPI
jgi:dihydrofolate synthase/folylpolyglutamate synthase